MSLASPFGDRLPKHTLDTYESRADAAVRVLSQICGMDPEREVARLGRVRDHLGHKIGKSLTLEQASELLRANPMQLVTQSLLEQMPTVFEMVLTLANGAPRGFAYLTQGSAATSLVEALTNLLRGTLALHLESGGSAAQAELVADVFRALFPNLPGLTEFSPLAQAMLVGVVPRGDQVELKLYFNTRLDTSQPHREKILRVLGLCGMNDLASYAMTYDALYAKSGREARFTGIGVDLGDDDGRIKMYVHAQRESAVAFIEDLVARGIAQGPLDQATRLIEATQSKSAASDCEVAFALRGSGPTTLKVTTFFTGKTVSADDGERVLALLDHWRYPTAPLREIFEALYISDSLVQAYPLHGVGVELTEAPMPKVNLYVQPSL